ncbi:DUF2259 domain-containing protein [Maritalea sp.]|uniref:DUF2259 domain-containing protein n=1 Tax=Maritalea sp. TaxID=2003361 RepID=UPI003EF29BB6
MTVFRLFSRLRTHVFSRVFLGILLLAGFGFSAAQAGDRALLDALGYSDDGRYFAFEEFGIQDGSGFAYSTIYLIDLEEDKWVSGSPYRARSDEDGVSLQTVRAQAASLAQDDLAAYAIERPADLIAYQADGEAQSNETEIEFDVPGFMGPSQKETMFKISLDIFKAPSSEPCIDYMGQEPMGFGVNFTDLNGDVSQIYADSNIPKSRGCPITYRPTAVFIPFNAYNFDHAVLVMSVWAHGFEGPDRRFIAVPF